MNTQTLEQYLRDNYAKGIIDHAFRANKEWQNVMKITIHPLNQNGETLDYLVDGDELIEINDED